MTELVSQASPGAGIQKRRHEYDDAIASVLGSGWYVLGSQVERFERLFADFIGVRHAVGVANGTGAIELALRAVGLQPGEAVFTVSHTAVATVVAIVRAGGHPVLVDIDPKRCTLDPEDLRRAVRELPAGTKPRAVVPVYLYGVAADMPSIVAISREEGMAVVEDCAHAHDASLEGQRVGSLGDIAAFSFYPTKNLAAIGDGGAVVTNDDETAAVLREFRQYGWRERYVSARFGFNSRLDEIQAAVLQVGLRYLADDNAARVAIADHYDRELGGGPLTLPTGPPGSTHVFHQYVVRSERRDELKAGLRHAA